LVWGGGSDEKEKPAAAPTEMAGAVPDRAPAAEPAAEPAARPEAEPAAEPAAEPEAEADPEAEPEPEPEAEAEAEAEPEPAAEPAVAVDPAGSDCTLRITGHPDGAPVLVGGKKIGSIPLETSVGCGEATVSVSHPRYEDASRTITLAPGVAGELDIRLNRPRHRLTITSTPSGADVSVGARRVGKTPVTTTVMGYEKVSVKVTHGGYVPWQERVYSRKANQSVSVKLKPYKAVPRKKPRGAKR